MNFLSKKENDLSNKFILSGYTIINVENKKSLNYIYKIILKATKNYLKTKKKN